MEKPILFCLSLLFALASCNTEQKKANKKLENEMIAVHDEVMPYMGEFVKDGLVIDSILNNLAQVKAENIELDTLQVKKDLRALKEKFAMTNDNMDDWMHKLTLDFQGKTDEQVKTYLEEELAAIEKIKEQYNAAIEEKRSVLDPLVK